MTPGPEPDLGPTPESIEQGAEPDDAYRAPGTWTEVHPPDPDPDAYAALGSYADTYRQYLANWADAELETEDPEAEIG